MYVCARVIRRLPAEGIAEGGNALAFGSSSVRVRIEREGDIVGFDHGWRKGIFSPLLITDVLILREEVERERDRYATLGIHLSIRLSIAWKGRGN